MITKLRHQLESEFAKFRTQKKYFANVDRANVPLEGYEVRTTTLERIADAVEDNSVTLVNALWERAAKNDQGNYDESLQVTDVPLAVAVTEKVEKFREEYFELLTELNVDIAKLRAAKVVSAAPNLQQTADANHAPRVRTPKIEIPTFDGSTSQWENFRDMFIALIHNNKQLTDIEKFHHLDQAMKLPSGQPNVLKNYRLSADCYETAWKAVMDRYDDKRKLLAHHLDAIFGMKKMNGASAAELRKLMDGVSSNLSSLKHHGYDLTNKDDLANLMIVHVVVQRMDEATRMEWRRQNKESTASWETLLNFLQTYWAVLDDPKAPSSDFKSTRVVEVKPISKGKAHNATTGDKYDRKPQCVVCNERHFTWECAQFQAMSIDSRYDVVNSNKLCLICFSKKHRRADCKSKFGCKCRGGHHELLHRASPQPQKSEAPKPPLLSPDVKPFVPFQMNLNANSNANVQTQSHSLNHSCAARVFAASSQKFLTTVLVLLEDADGELHECRALLDQGSDTNFITKRMTTKLNLPLDDHLTVVHGIDGGVRVGKHVTHAKIKSRYGEFEMSLPFTVMETVTGNIPSQRVRLENFEDLSSFFLADPRFGEAEECDMLLDTEVFHECRIKGEVKLSSGPTLTHSTFGWLIGGALKRVNDQPRSLLSSFACHAALSESIDVDQEHLTRQLMLFMEREEVDSSHQIMTAQERYCEETFRDWFSRDSNGRFVVAMPYRIGLGSLGSNLRNCEKQFTYLEQRFRKDPELKRLYVEYLNEYIESGDMCEVDPSDDSCYYMPHHGVKKMTSTTTKVRPVFNASSASESGKSLNDFLCVGPKVQPESFDILLRFREKQFAVTGDIAQMYRRVLIYENQRRWMRIVWRANEEDPIKHYELNTVTFGTACASFLATRVVHQLSIDCADKYPEASDILAKAFYVDDCMFSCDTISEGKMRLLEIREILEDACMRLRKISATDSDIVKFIPAADLDTPAGSEKQLKKALGLVFDEVEDTFSYKIEMREATTSALTKANVLSQIASIYDPIGWLGPVVITAKIFMRKLMKFGWKEKLPADLIVEWFEFRGVLHEVNNVKIPRFMIISSFVRLELHGFSDASIRAYGACIYAVSEDANGQRKSSLMCAKSRIAPSKQKSLARLELCAAVLLSKLIARVVKILTLAVDEIVLWSDSTIALHWMAMEPGNLSVYVGNRVAVVQDLTHAYKWKHISGVNNPADIISRGLAPNEIQEKLLWWYGAPFLTQRKSEWPESILTINDNDDLWEMEAEVKKVHSTQNVENSLFHFIETRFSDTKKTVKTIAYVLRAVKIMKAKKRTNLEEIVTGSHEVVSGAQEIEKISVEELDAAKFEIVRQVQQTLFPNEYATLKEARIYDEQLKPELAPSISSKSPLLSLAPFMDEQGIMRVGGRIGLSEELPRNQRHPILITKCNFMMRYIKEMHERDHHSTQLSLRASLRLEFWMLRAAAAVKAVIRSCLPCFRARPIASHQFMAELPAGRVNFAPPFTRTAVDYAGFFTIKSGSTRNAPSTKCYVAVFKCIVSSGIHLEVVVDLSTQAFLNALDRFIARRGLCREIFSDNATCFEGADNELKRIASAMDSEVEKYCTDRSIKWQFTTPRAPHAGGIYESGVKLMKKHLKQLIIKNYTYEQFSSILCKIEAILNSRPLTPMSNDPNDLRALTVGDLLIGRPLTARNEYDVTKFFFNRLSYYESLNQVAQLFWQRWRKEYIPEQQRRPKNFRIKYSYNVGDFVLVNDPCLPPRSWLMGRIAAVHPGKDKVVRTVTVKTVHGELKRHVKYLSILPLDSEFVAGREDVSGDREEAPECEDS